MSDTISDTNQAPNLVRNRFLNLVQNVASYHLIFLQNIKCDTQSQNRPPVGRNLKHVSLQKTRLWGVSCTVRHARSKTTARPTSGRSKFILGVATTSAPSGQSAFSSNTQSRNRPQVGRIQITCRYIQVIFLTRVSAKPAANHL